MLYRPKWDFGCSQKRLPIKLKNRHGGCQDFKKMRFSAKFERGFPVRLKTHFRLLEPIIGGRPSPVSQNVTDNYFVSEKNLPFQKYRYLQHIQVFYLPRKPVITLSYTKSSRRILLSHLIGENFTIFPCWTNGYLKLCNP